MKKNSIVLVEDDVELAAMIQEYLTAENFEVHWVDNGYDAVEQIKRRQPDLVLLDLMLPKLNGIEVCRQIRSSYFDPVLMLTAKDDDMVEVTSLNTGANGYLTKPVRPHVLLAHIQAQLRSAGDKKQTSSRGIQVQDLVVDKASIKATIGDKPLNLTYAEFRLLLFFCERAGQTISRNALYENLKGIPFDGIDRAMDMQISVLRRKMADEKPPYKYIKTVRSKGYMLAIR